MTDEWESTENKNNSIKVSKTSTGKYNFEVKIYYKDAEDSKSTVDKIEAIYKDLNEKFKVD